MLIFSIDFFYYLKKVSLIQSKFLEKEKEANDLTSKLNVMEEKIIIEEQKQMKGGLYNAPRAPLGELTNENHEEE